MTRIAKKAAFEVLVKTYRKLSPPKPLYEMNDSTLKVNHSAGVFSCYTVRLEAILEYYRTYKKLPLIVDSSQQFSAYKNNTKEDISAFFFETIEDFQIMYQKPIYTTYEPDLQQFSDYSKLNFSDLKPFVDKFFGLSKSIRVRVERLVNDLPWDYQSICGILYRGGDKNLETNPPPYAEMILKAVKLKQKNPQIKFLIQTDEQEFLKYAIRELGNECYCHTKVSGGDFSIGDYVAAIFILSQCKYLITTSGNGEYWIRIFRGDNRGGLQWISPKEYIYGIKNKSFDPDKKHFWIDTEKLIS